MPKTARTLIAPVLPPAGPALSRPRTSEDDYPSLDTLARLGEVDHSPVTTRLTHEDGTPPPFDPAAFILDSLSAPLRGSGIGRGLALGIAGSADLVTGKTGTVRGVVRRGKPGNGTGLVEAGGTGTHPRPADLDKPGLQSRSPLEALLGAPENAGPVTGSGLQGVGATAPDPRTAQPDSSPLSALLQDTGAAVEPAVSNPPTEPESPLAGLVSAPERAYERPAPSGWLKTIDAAEGVQAAGEPAPLPVSEEGTLISDTQSIEPGSQAVPPVYDVEPRGANAGIFEPGAQVAQGFELNPEGDPINPYDVPQPKQMQRFNPNRSMGLGFLDDARRNAPEPLRRGWDILRATLDYSGQLVGLVTAPIAAGGLSALTELGRVKNATNAYFNTYTKTITDFYARNPDLEPKADKPDHIWRAWTSKASYDAIWDAISKGGAAASRAYPNNASVPLKGMVEFIVPHTKNVKMEVPQDLGAFLQEQGVKGLFGQGNTISTEDAYLNADAALAGFEQMLADQGYTSASGDLHRLRAGLKPVQRNALKKTFISAANAGDFVADFVIDPTDIVLGAGKVVWYGAVKKVPALRRVNDVIETATTYQGWARAARNPKLKQLLTDTFGDASKPVQMVEGFGTWAEGQHLTSKLREELSHTKLAIAQDTNVIARSVQKLRNYQRAIHKAHGGGKPGAGLAQGFDKWVFDWADAGAPHSTYHTRAAVEAEMVKAGYRPEDIKMLREVGDDIATMEATLGANLVKTGMLDEATYLGMQGRHIRHFYTRGKLGSAASLQSALDEMLTGRGKSSLKINLGFSKQRKGSDPAAKIESAAFAHGLGARQETTALHRFGFTQKVADNPDLALPAGDILERQAKQLPIVDEVLDSTDGHLTARRKFGKKTLDVYVKEGDTVDLARKGNAKLENVTVESLERDTFGTITHVNFKPAEGTGLGAVMGPIRVPIDEIKSGDAGLFSHKGTARFSKFDLPVEGIERVAPEAEAKFLKAKRTLGGKVLDDFAGDGDTVTLRDKASGRETKGRLSLRHNADGSIAQATFLPESSSGLSPFDFDPDDVRLGSTEIERSSGLYRARAEKVKTPGPGKPNLDQQKALATAMDERVRLMETENRDLEDFRKRVMTQTFPGGVGERNQQLAIINEQQRMNRQNIALLKDMKKRGSVDVAGTFDPVTGDMRPGAVVELENAYNSTKHTAQQLNDALNAHRATKPPKVGTKARAAYDRKRNYLTGQAKVMNDQLDLREAALRETRRLRYEQTVNASVGVINDLKKQRKTLQEKIAFLRGNSTADPAQLAQYEWLLTQVDSQVAAIETRRKARIAADEIVDAENKQVRNQVDDFLQANGLDASSNAAPAPGHFIQMPDDPKYGALAGMMVHPVVRQFIETAADPFYDVPLSGLARKTVSYIKYVKTALNPATHVTNNIGNVILAETGANMNGVSIFKDPRLWKLAADEIRNGGAWTDLIQKHSNIFYETSDLIDAIRNGGDAVDYLPKSAGQKAADFARTGLTLPGHAFAKEEQFSKMLLFITLAKDMQKKGMGLDAAGKKAAELTQKYLFDYSDVPHLVEIARKYGFAPFATFPYKATGVLVDVMTNKPSLINRINVLRGQAWGAFPEAKTQYDELVSRKPWLANKVIIPVGKEGNEDIFLDLSRQIPFGFFDAEQWSAKQLIGNSFVGGLPTGAAVQDTFNQRTFTGQPFVPEGMNPVDADNTRRSAYMQTYLPALGLPRLKDYPLGIGNALDALTKPGFSNATTDTETSPAGLRLERGGGVTGLGPRLQERPTRLSITQRAWVSTAQSLLGLSFMQREGVDAPGVLDNLANRKEQAGEDKAAIKGKLSDPLKMAVQAFNGVADKEGNALLKFPSVQKDIKTVQAAEILTREAEKVLERTTADGSIPRNVKLRRLENQILYIYALKARKLYLMMQAGEIPPEE